MSLSQNSIPQLVIQEVFIPEGNNNNVQQVINQDLVVYVLEIPDDLDDVTFISQFLQTDDDIGSNNQVDQTTRQSIPEFPLFPNNYTSSNNLNPVDLDFNQYINNDGVLETVQFSNQQVVIEGNNNNVNLYAEQIVYDLSWYDRFDFDDDDDDFDDLFDDNVTFDDFLADFAGDVLLDSVQVGVQDTILFGGRNNVVQQLDQTLATFILIDEDDSIQLQGNASDLSPVQFAFQESFLDTNNNTIDQTIYQNIELDFSFSDDFSDHIDQLSGQRLTNPSFNVDDFILPILENNLPSSPFFQNNEVLANQNNFQNIDILGNGNTDNLNSSQIVVLGDDSREVISGSSRNDNFVAGRNNFDGLQDLIFLGEGNDRVDLSNALSDLNVNPFFLPTNNVIRAGKGNDRVIAYRGDRIFGENGRDSLSSTQGGRENIFYGGKGNDTLTAGLNDTLVGNRGNDLLHGGRKDDLLLGGLGNDTLKGKGGNDILSGQFGSDRLSGGKGDDIYRVNDRGDRVLENVNQGNDQVISDISYTLPNNVERLVLTGNRNLIGRGNQLANRLNGNDGNNLLFGYRGNDVLDGGLGSDTLDGGAGGDRLFGSEGNDFYYVDNSADNVIESVNQGIDQVISSINYTLGKNLENLTLTGRSDRKGVGNQLNNRLIGNQGQNILLGSGGNDNLLAKGGNDTLNGGIGRDRMVGGQGSDLYYVDNLNDLVIESSNQGQDTVRSQASYTLPNHVEKLILNGNSPIDGIGNNVGNTIIGNNSRNLLAGRSGNDILVGGNGHDTLNGNAGNDTLNGGNGNDLIDGGTGRDRLIGGIGNDTFVLDDNDNFPEVIADFQAGIDTIGLAGGLTFSDLSFAQNNILQQNQIIATLSGFDATSLTRSDFTILN